MPPVVVHDLEAIGGPDYLEWSFLLRCKLVAVMDGGDCYQDSLAWLERDRCFPLSRVIWRAAHHVVVMTEGDLQVFQV